VDETDETDRRRRLRLDGDKVRQARERLGYSMEMTGEEAEVSKNSILRAEHGEDIRPVTARRISRALGVEVADLIEGSARPAALQSEEDEILEEEQRRTRAFLQAHPYEEERAEYLREVLRIHTHYKKLYREVIAAVREKDTDILGLATVLKFFNFNGLQHALEESGVIAYINSVLQEKVEASPRERENCRSFAKQLDAEIAEALRVIEDLQKLARGQHGARSDVEEMMSDIEAYLAGGADSGGRRSNAPAESL
jgi:transcriptional regulator with XRE-family HTH domain